MRCRQCIRGIHSVGADDGGYEEGEEVKRVGGVHC